MNLKKALQLLLGLGITALTLYLFLKSSDLSEISASLKKINPLIMVPIIGLLIFTFWLRGLRWKYLLPETPGASREGLFPLVTIAFMLNNVLPFRLGEAARVYLLYKKNRQTVHLSLGSLISERVFDIFFYACFVAVPALIYRGPLSGKTLFGKNGLPSVDAAYPVRLAILCIAAVFLLFLIYRLFPKTLLKAGDYIAGQLWTPLGRGLSHLLILIRESTAFIFDRAAFIRVVLLSPLVVGCYSAIIWVISLSLGMELSFFKCLFISGFIAFGVAVPSAPGFVGTLHLACMEAALLFHGDTGTAAALAILYHITTWVPTILLGLFFYFRLDINFREIRQAAPEMQ